MDNGIHDKLLRSEGEEVGDLKERVYDESKKIWRIALPGIVARVASFGALIVTQSFIGHISAVDLAAYALVQTLTVRFANGILIGMSSATETLCGQAYGAKQYHMMGIYLQRSWIVNLITCTLLMPLFIFGGAIFRLLGEESDIAYAAGYISWWFIPLIYNFVFTLTIQMYLQAQQKNIVVAWISIVQIIVHVLLSWLFVYHLNLGIPGAMTALNISSLLVSFVELVYILGGWCPETWTGFSSAAFKDLLPVIKLSISSGVMVCLELWYNSILVLLAGYMHNAEVAISAFSICLNINGWEFMLCLGFLGAACVRIANELGRGDVNATKFSIKVLLSTSVLIGVACTIPCLAFGHNLGYLFTNDEAVVKAVANLSHLLAISVLLNSIYPVLSGVSVGAGLQGTVAIINLCCYYLVGIPIGALLGYVAGLQVEGIWIGMIIGILVQTLALSYMAFKTDWDLQVKLAAERLQRWALKSPDKNGSA
ncbi:protein DETOXIFICATION 25-like [Salvia hispanica]|uniref:protein DETOXIFICATION 25-like n=1 Tax=Salvia hispanica TaxID=49212 RepID=UPI0020094186|nr:protein DETOXIFICATION 25-like [Salvia hispanica]XP_047946474.1 protein DETOXIFICATION 25-like [Salvia hispanica]XP_047946475.1 protein DETOXIFICATION 25-like [Salvia hispanica]